ncbi:MAG: glutamate-1-semialdehyde 2,1-aminomutase [Deltaproteobacteria bacterium]|nr:glutamate-1-semialdehyde 2,1-aminomutase [Deltaproteobacteria bacterium]MCL5277877.1 glutamate-1-semialdehyde 2,1-aminomutase [Deltaproteobacteria bacterium]
MRRPHSHNYFMKAVSLMPGGVNSPVRAFKAVGDDPIVVTRAKGDRLYDADGNRYIDYCMSWGPMILGHGNIKVLNAIRKAVRGGTSFGTLCPYEVRLAELIAHAYRSIELVRMVSSGTEATMSAVRVARAYTKRDRIVKFEGGYHGHSDQFLIKAGSGLATLGTPSSPGVPEAFASLTLTLPYNDPDTLQRLISERWREIAAVIVEPVAGNMGVVPPVPGFLETLRESTARHGIVLIFDEVITGLRLSLSGAQGVFRISPDMTTLGKIIGGGMPVGAYGGKKEIMDMVSPEGAVYQAGTLSGNPVAMAAGIATIKEINSGPEFYKDLEKKTSHLVSGLKDAARLTGKAITINSIGSMFTPFFTDGAVCDLASAMRSDTKLYAGFFRRMFEKGVYMPPSQFEAHFMSIAHSAHDIDRTIKYAYEALREL